MRADHLLLVTLLASAVGACAPPPDDSEPDEAPPEVFLDPELVMDELTVLPSDAGFDLTGDGVPDNGLAKLFEHELLGAALGGDPNDYIAGQVQDGEMLVLLDFNQLSDFDDDDHVGLEILLGSDPDGDAANNFDGGALGVQCGSLTDDGAAVSGFDDLALADGELSGEGGEFRLVIAFSNTEAVLRDARLEGVLGSDGERIEDGLLGGAIPYEDLAAIVENDPEIGAGFGELMLAFFENQLDVDLDGDGALDALSAAFSFSAVATAIDRESPCVD